MKSLSESKDIILNKLQRRIGAYNATSNHIWLADQLKHTFFPAYPGKYGYGVALKFSEAIASAYSWHDFCGACFNYFKEAGNYGIVLLKEALEEITAEKFIFPFINFFLDYATSYENEQNKFILRCLGKLQQDVPMQMMAFKRDQLC